MTDDAKPADVAALTREVGRFLEQLKKQKPEAMPFSADEFEQLKRAAWIIELIAPKLPPLCGCASC